MSKQSGHEISAILSRTDVALISLGICNSLTMFVVAMLRMTLIAKSVKDFT